MANKPPLEHNESKLLEGTFHLTVAKSSLKSRSSNCLTDPVIASWLPGIQQLSNPHWTANVSVPIRDDGGSSQSNSNFGCPWPEGDTQRLKAGSSRRKKRKKKSSKLLEEDKEDDQLSPLGRRIIVFVAVSLFLVSILLVGVTLRLGPIIDEMVRKGNEEIYRSMSAGASTSSPTTEAANTTTPSSGTPG